MNAAPLFDMFVTLFAVGLALNIGVLVAFLAINRSGERRSTLPSARLMSRTR